jgi:hypothetical protein
MLCPTDPKVRRTGSRVRTALYTRACELTSSRLSDYSLVKEPTCIDASFRLGTHRRTGQTSAVTFVTAVVPRFWGGGILLSAPIVSTGCCGKSQTTFPAAGSHVISILSVLRSNRRLRTFGYRGFEHRDRPCRGFDSSTGVILGYADRLSSRCLPWIGQGTPVRPRIWPGCLTAPPPGVFGLYDPPCGRPA